MNFYVVVEGEKGEKIVYEKWIKYVCPHLRRVDNINQVTNNNFIIFAGNGYPFYFDVITAAIGDVNANGQFDRLVVVVDSEEMSFDDKFSEISTHVNLTPCRIPVHIIVQHFCLETWALANRNVVTRNPQSPRLREYLSFFNVIDQDPELMPAFPPLNRSQFAFRYIKSVLNEKYRNLTYSKSNPKVLLNRKYFDRVCRRHRETGHIPSFSHFLTAFV